MLVVSPYKRWVGTKGPLLSPQPLLGHMTGKDGISGLGHYSSAGSCKLKEALGFWKLAFVVRTENSPSRRSEPMAESCRRHCANLQTGHLVHTVVKDHLDTFL